MDIKFWASFSVICLLLQCCQICESRPRPGRCKGLIKPAGCPTSNISITKRLLDEIMKRTDDSDLTENTHLEDQTRTVDETEFNDGETYVGRAPSDDWGLPTGDDNEDQLDAREQEEDELRRKELELLFVRALLDDLENETFADM